MSSKRKKSKAVPVVIVLALLAVILAAGCFYAAKYIPDYKATALEKEQAAVRERNDRLRQQWDAEYATVMSDYEQRTSSGANLAWPAQKTEGWDLIDLTSYPLENQTSVTMTRSDVMNNGMLLVNQWHSRPDDFANTEASLVRLGKYFSWKIQVQDASVSLFPVAADALKEAIDAAGAEGLAHYLVSEGYRSFDTQNTYFQKKKEKLASKYTNETQLIEATKKEVNYPGTSEFNSGLAFTLRLYDKTDAEVGKPKYSTTAQGIWMNENCWKYGLVFRFPLYNWPLEGTLDKSFKTGIGSDLNLYRYVGKGNAAAMHYLDMCLEEYVEYLEEHPHIALFEDGRLKYEIYRQYVGDDSSFQVILTGKTRNYSSSLDNMGGIVTVFEY